MTEADPVAAMTAPAWWTRALPEASRTSTLPPPSSLPSPATTSTPSRFSVAATPPRSFSTTSRFQACMTAQSKLTPEAFTPNRAPSSACTYCLAELINVLVGMQPTLRQVPPSAPFSTSRTFFLAAPSRSAAT